MPKVLPVLILVVAATLLTTACGPRTTAPAHPAQVGGRPAPGNPEAGKQVFLVCTACHSLAPGQNMVGPSLHGLIGRRAGTAPGFQYSAANKASGLIWTEPELNTYLDDPQKTVPGTYMTYAGVKDPQKRADLIAYLVQATK